MDPVGGRIYWGNGAGVKSANLDGDASSVRDFSPPNGGWVLWLAIDVPGNRIYWTGIGPESGRYIWSCSLDLEQSGFGWIYVGDTSEHLYAVATAVTCVDSASSDDSDPCTFDQCVNGGYVTTPALYGDVAGSNGTCGPDDTVDLLDILAVLNGFQASFVSPCDRSNIDIAGDAGICSPNGVIDLADILVVLDAFGGDQACCPAP